MSPTELSSSSSFFSRVVLSGLPSDTALESLKLQYRASILREWIHRWTSDLSQRPRRMARIKGFYQDCLPPIGCFLTLRCVRLEQWQRTRTAQRVSRSSVSRGMSRGRTLDGQSVKRVMCGLVVRSAWKLSRIARCGSAQGVGQSVVAKGEGWLAGVDVANRRGVSVLW